MKSIGKSFVNSVPFESSVTIKSYLPFRSYRLIRGFSPYRWKICRRIIVFYDIRSVYAFNWTHRWKVVLKAFTLRVDIETEKISIIHVERSGEFYAFFFFFSVCYRRFRYSSNRVKTSGVSRHASIASSRKIVRRAGHFFTDIIKLLCRVFYVQRVFVWSGRDVRFGRTQDTDTPGFSTKVIRGIEFKKETGFKK